MRKIIILGILALQTVSLCVGCGNSDKKDNEKETTEKATTTVLETTVEETTTITEEEFIENKEGFVEYVKATYSADAECDAPNSFFYTIYDEDNNFAAKVGYLYFETDDIAKQYVETALKMFSKEDITNVELGDEGVLYTPPEPEDETVKKWPHYLFVRVGKNVYYCTYYDGYEEVSNSYMDAIVK